MGEISTVSFFVDKFKNHSNKKEIEKAVLNYNNLVLAADCDIDWELQECDLDYDIFNLTRFYDFCRETPNDYTFIENERTPELDEIIIGFWLKKHQHIES